MPTLSLNKKGLFDYQVVEKLEAGIALSGPEVKSVKKGQINLTGSYIVIDAKNEAKLIGAHINPYKPAASHQIGYDPSQTRKILIHKKEIDYLRGKTREKGLTIMPISVYTKGGLIKIEIGLVKGKKQFDKREIIKKREIERDLRKKIKY